MPHTPIHPNSDESQDRLMDEALGVVKVQSFQMKCCLEKGKLMEALKHASNMLSELRTSMLSPKAYYELYMAVTDQLRHLEFHLTGEFEKGCKLADLYELVQYAGNIIPRLYLLVTVGLVYMKTTKGCRRDILKDLVEMCRGVQHPLRGLFLRNYLLQSCKNVLPDVVVEEIKGPEKDAKEEHSGTIEDSIDFILVNYGEMNKLWVRMQHQGHSSQKERREKERLDLRLLVGTNLTRLSELECVTQERYKNVVLPGILEQVVSCRDAISQEYLMESLIQVFPDDFHLATLQPFLNSCAQLVPSVNVKTIIIALIDRLASSKDVPLPDDLFDIFSEQITNIIKSRPEIPLEDVVSMQTSLVNFCIKKIDQDDKCESSLNAVLGSTLEVIKTKCPPNQVHYRTNIGKELLKFLKVPIALSTTSCSGIAAIKMSLKLTNFKEILKQVTDIELHKQVVLLLLNCALESGLEDRIEERVRLSPEEIEIFLSQICAPLIEGPKVEEGDELDEDFLDEQTLLARFIHYILSPYSVPDDDYDLLYDVITLSKRILLNGGPKRIRHTFPSLVFESLQLAIKYANGRDKYPDWDKKCSKLFQFVHQTIIALLKDSNCPELCLRLFLEAAVTAKKCTTEDSETVAYEFISQSFSVYEEEINDSKQQLASLTSIISTINAINFTSDENLKPLQSQCCLNAVKLVKKSDQCRATLAASFLYFNCKEKTIGPEAVKWIQKCFKIASAVLDLEVQLQLFIEILAHLTILVDCASDEISSLVKQLVEKIEEQRQETPMSDLIERQYYNSLDIFSNIIDECIIKSLSCYKKVTTENNLTAVDSQIATKLKSQLTCNDATDSTTTAAAAASTDEEMKANDQVTLQSSNETAPFSNS